MIMGGTSPLHLFDLLIREGRGSTMRRKLLHSKKRIFVRSLKAQIKQIRDTQKLKRFIPPDGQTVVKLKQTMVELQTALAVAIRTRNPRLVSSATQRILCSKLCQSYEVYRTISSQGSSSLGVSATIRPLTNENSESLCQKVWQAVQNPHSYKASPLKRIFIPKWNTTELRPLSVASYVNRALQHLYLLPRKVRRNSRKAILLASAFSDRLAGQRAR